MRRAIDAWAGWVREAVCCVLALTMQFASTLAGGLAGSPQTWSHNEFYSPLLVSRAWVRPIEWSYERPSSLRSPSVVEGSGNFGGRSPLMSNGSKIGLGCFPDRFCIDHESVKQMQTVFKSCA